MTMPAHDKRHDGHARAAAMETSNTLPLRQLPLKDLNLHSSDPESVQRTATLETDSVRTGQKAPVSDTTHTIAHTVKATVASDEGRIAAFLLKRWCYRIYRQALRSGRLVPGPCFADGVGCSGKQGNGHHHDYSQPLNVVWCCLAHHHRLDALRRAGHSLASAMVELLLLREAA